MKPPIHADIDYNPLQLLTEKHVDEDCNVVVQAPTSSGKTVVAEQFMYPALAEGGRIIYLSPLKALTNEKLKDWESLPFSKIAITSDFDTPAQFDQRIVLMTTESLDSKTRGMKSWLSNVKCLVADEAHMLAMDKRGDAFEVGLTRFASICPGARIIFLSATFPNVDEIATWLTTLNGKPTRVVNTDWRPVVQEHHLVKAPAKRYQFFNKLFDLIANCNKKHPNTQMLIFVHTLGVGRLLAKQLGCEFHNSRLSKEKRADIERKFRLRQLGCLVTTSTLAYGVNLPADVGIIVGSKRGPENVDPMDIKQEAGRIGRYGLSSRGQVYYYFQEQDANERYFDVMNIPPVKSVLKRRLYFHLTSFIAREEMQREEILQFIARTLGQQQGDLLELVDDAIDQLFQYGIIYEKDGKMQASSLGRASAYLYVDPIDLYFWKRNFSSKPMNPAAIGAAYANIPSFEMECWVPDDLDNPIQMNYGLQTILATAMRDWLDMKDLEDNVNITLMSHVRDFPRIVAALSMAGLEKVYCKTLELMLVNGVGLHLVPLVGIKGIGRKRAEALYRHGIKDPKDIPGNPIARNILTPKIFAGVCAALNPTSGKITLVF